MQQLTGGDVLTTIAEIAAALAGFVALISVFRPRSNQPMGRDEILGQRLILESSFLTLFIALLPLLFFNTFNTETHLWRISSLTALGIFLIWYSRLRTNARQHELKVSSQNKSFLGLLWWGITLIILIVQLVNIIILDDPAPYLWWTAYVLTLPVNQFLTFVYAYLEAQAQPVTDSETSETEASDTAIG